MTTPDPELLARAQQFCRFVCRRASGACSIDDPLHGGLQCPLWRFVHRDPSTLRPPPWIEQPPPPRDEEVL